MTKIKGAVDSIETIDQNILKKLSQEQKSDIKEQLDALENLIEELRHVLKE